MPQLFETGTRARVNTLAISGSTYTPNANSTDRALIIDPPASAVIAKPTGTPTDGQQLLFRIKSGAATSFSWETGVAGAYLPSGVAALPTSTVSNKTVTAAFEYDAAIARFVCFANDTNGYG